jgi:uncharacterized surface protein with fasciclin (FAS1) repeats
MRTRTPAALAIVAALALAACGDDSTDPVADAPIEATDEAMRDDEMADDDMADDDMADDDMADDDMADDDMADMNDVMSLIIDRDDLSVLDDAIHAAGLDDTLHIDGPFTVFAPTNAAFEAYLGEMGMSVDDVLADTATLTALLQAHVVAGSDDSAMVMDMAGQSFTTLAGNELAVVVDGDIVTVGGATVTEYDLSASNGVIHVIDTVLTPPAG